MLQINDLVDPSGFGKEEYIRLLYEIILQRDPDPVSLEKLLDRKDTQNFFKEFVSSAEFRGKAQNSCYSPGLRLAPSARPRILLFGAYGNGNLGDKIQAESLLRAVRQIRPDVEVWACSALRAMYPFPFDRVLPGEAFNNPRIVNSFDMLMIGGGGLLSHPHDPLTNVDWQKAISIPVAFIGIGAAAEVVARSEILVRKAVYISVRDDHSMSSMQKFAQNASFLADPVLCDAHHDVRAGARTPRRPRANRKLWILKYFGAEQTQQWRDIVDPERDEVCFLEPSFDFPLLIDFPFARAAYRTDDLLTMIDSADMVISMRYHGCILGMLRDRPIVGVREHKSLDLLRRYGNERFFARTMDDIPADISQYKAPDDLLVRDRAKFIAEMSGLLATVKGRDRPIERLATRTPTAAAPVAEPKPPAAEPMAPATADGPIQADPA